MTIQSILEGYNNKTLSSKDVFDYYYEQITTKDASLNSFITLREKDEVLSEITENSIPIGHKDIYSTQGIETTAASNILKGYVPRYDATSVTRLKEKNFVTVGKLNCDAFAHGGAGEYSDMGVTKNPYDLERTPGGSSSGSAVSVSAGLLPVATGTDTGGSIRLPASYTNTVGLKPTYGRVSRYGVISMTSSTDSIGHFTKTVWDNAYILSITAGKDPYDATSSNTTVENYLSEIDKGVKGLKIGIAKEYIEQLKPDVVDDFMKSIEILTSLGVEIINISLPHTEYGVATYYIITPAEVSSNLSRFTGIRFGQERSTFGAENKRRIMIGTYCLSSGYYDAYYLKAQKVRTLIVEDFNKAFNVVDAIVAPVSADYPPKLGESTVDPITSYMVDALTIPANMAGIPSLSVPAGFRDGLPRGIQFMGPHFSEKLLYQIGYAFEQETEFYKITPKLS